MMPRYTPASAYPAEQLTERLAWIERIHEEWGNTDSDDVEQLDLWERIGLALSGIEPA